jgi:hypothetical protein
LCVSDRFERIALTAEDIRRCQIGFFPIAICLLLRLGERCLCCDNGILLFGELASRKAGPV